MRKWIENEEGNISLCCLSQVNNVTVRSCVITAQPPRGTEPGPPCEYKAPSPPLETPILGETWEKTNLIEKKCDHFLFKWKDLYCIPQKCNFMIYLKHKTIWLQCWLYNGKLCTCWDSWVIRKVLLRMFLTDIMCQTPPDGTCDEGCLWYMAKASSTTSQAALGSLQCSRKQGLMDSLWSSWSININECERDLAGDWDTKQFWQWFARCPEERWGVSAASETLHSATRGTGRTVACSNLRLCMDLNQHSCWRNQEKEAKRSYDSMRPYLRKLAGISHKPKIKQVRVRTWSWYEKEQVYNSLVTLLVTSTGYRGELELKEFEPFLCKC